MSFQPFHEVSFLTPWAVLFPILFLLLPFLRRKARRAALPVTSLSGTASIRNSPLTLLLYLGERALLLLFIAALTAALVQPVKTEYIAEERRSRNIILSLDISKSMQTRDFASPLGVVQRIQAVKGVVADFIGRRGYDRLGLVVFGSSAYLQAPLTFDHDFLKEVVRQLSVGYAGSGTAIGDGLGLAIKRIAPFPSESRAIILLTDGANNSGSVDPIKAARIARDLGIRVYTIGIGSRGGFHGLLGPSGDFDEALLQRVAALTHGRYYLAEDLASLNKVYTDIDALERVDNEDPRIYETEPLAPFFTAAAFLFFLLHLFVSQLIIPRYP